MFEALELCIKLVVPRVKDGYLENECGHAYAEAGDRQISVPKHFLLIMIQLRLSIYS